LQFSPLVWSIALLLFLIVGLNLCEKCSVGHGVLKVMDGEWQKMTEQGVNFQLNSSAEKTLQNTTTNLPFCHIAGWFVAKS
jgi:hypothetical protein